MNVEILVNGPYAKFNPGGKQTAQQLEAGDVVEFPDAYASDLINSKMAKGTKAKATIIEVQAREVIFEEDLDSEKSLPEQMNAALKKGNAGRREGGDVTAKELGGFLKDRKRG